MPRRLPRTDLPKTRIRDADKGPDADWKRARATREARDDATAAKALREERQP